MFRRTREDDDSITDLNTSGSFLSPHRLQRASTTTTRRLSGRVRSWGKAKEEETIDEDLEMNNLYMRMSKIGLDWRIGMPFDPNLQVFDSFFSFFLDQERVFSSVTDTVELWKSEEYGLDLSFVTSDRLT